MLVQIYIKLNLVLSHFQVGGGGGGGGVATSNYASKRTNAQLVRRCD